MSCDHYFTRYFYGNLKNVHAGLIPKSMPKQQTVRDVKRHSETRREGRKKEEGSHVKRFPFMETLIAQKALNEVKIKLG